MMRLQAIAVLAALATVPLAAGPPAFAQDDAQSAKGMKGPPNANGYGKEKMGKTTTDDGKSASGKDMKGPPNADGYDKK